jgi:hypothetical protein
VDEHNRVKIDPPIPSLLYCSGKLQTFEMKSGGGGAYCANFFLYICMPGMYVYIKANISHYCISGTQNMLSISPLLHCREHTGHTVVRKYQSQRKREHTCTTIYIGIVTTHCPENLKRE